MIDTQWFRTVLTEALDLDDAEAALLTDDTDLVELGLDSLRMISVSDRMAREGVRVHFSELVMDPTISAWVRLAADATNYTAPETTPANHTTDTVTPDGEPTDDFPLGTMQHAYWLGRRKDQRLGGVAAHLYVEFDGTAPGGDQDHFADALGTAARGLVHRHPMLRTQIVDTGLQRVMPAPDVTPLTVTDGRDWSPEKIHTELDRLRTERSHQLLDLAAGQVWQLALTLLPDGRHRLHVDVDMVAADAMSYRTLMEDLAMLTQHELGGSMDLTPLDVTYRDYRLTRARALADPDSAESRRAARDREWWSTRVPHLPDPPELPFIPEDRRRDPQASIRLAETITPDDYNALHTYAHRRGLTTAMVVATVFTRVLGAWSNNDHMLVNMPLFAREPIHPDINSVVGDFTNSVMVAASAPATVPFTEAVRALSKEVHHAAAHSAHTGLDVLRDMGRDRGHPVTANVVYTSGLDLGDLFSPLVREQFGTPSHIISQGPQVDLDAQVVDMDGGLLVNWDVRRDCLPDRMVQDMFHAFTTCVRTLAAHDAAWDQPLDIPLPHHQEEVRREVNATDVDLPAHTLHAPVLTHAQEHPDQTALLWDGGSLTYGDLVRRAGAVARELRQRGVHPGDTVALQIPRGPHQLTAILGTLMAGAAYLPINITQPAARRDTIIADGRASQLLTHDDVTTFIADTPALDDAIASAQQTNPSPHSVAYVLFTSGSTGRPKGVDVSHAAAANTLDSIARRFALDNPAPTALALSAYDFDLSVLDLFLPLGLGGRVVLLREDQARDAVAWARLVDVHGVDLINCAPGLIGMLHEVATPAQLASLRLMLTGGDRVPVALAHAVRRTVPGLVFVGLGGATETAIHSTVQIVDDSLPGDLAAVPYGTPLDNVRMRVVNAAGQDTPDLVTGELWIGGASLAEGYRGDPERTADRFVTVDGQRWYRTGDMARYHSDGTVEFVGRRDNRVKLRGFRVELGEVEAALETLDGVEAATALVTEDGRLAAAVHMATGTVGDPALTSENLRRDVATVLPAHMVPATVVVVDALPVTANGKKDRTAVAAAVAAAEAESSPVVGPGVDDDAPDGAVEEALLYLLSDVLGLTTGPVRSATADFFELGGDSIQATGYTARIREFLGVERMTVADVLEHSSVRQLAARLTALEPAPGALHSAAELLLELAGVEGGS